MSLRTRLFLVLILTAMGPVILAGSWFLRSNARAEENARQLHRQIAVLSADLVEKSAQDMNRAFGFVLDLERSGRRTETDDLRILQQTITTHPSFVLLSLLDSSGKETLKISDKLLFAEPQRVDRSSCPIVALAIKTQRVAVGPVEVRQEAPLITLAYPLSNGRSLYAAYDLSSLWKRVQSLKVGEQGRVLLLGREGFPLPGVTDNSVFPASWKAPAAGEDKFGWYEELNIGKHRFVGAYALTPSFGWRALTFQPRDEAYAIGAGFGARATMFLLFLTVIVIIAAYWIARKLVGPLASIIAASRRAAANDFSQKVPEPGWGELNELAQTFNAMMGTLQSYEEMQVEKLLEEKARIDALVQTIPDGILLAGFDGSIAYMNSSSKAILRTPKDLQPKTVHEVTTLPVVREMFAGLLSRRRRLENAELQIDNEQGEPIGHYDCRGVTVLKDRKEIGVLLLMHDITDQKQMERMKEDFFHSIVHDLRNPVATIEGFMQMLISRGNLTQNEKNYIEYINRSIEVLRDMVSNILTLSKIESGTMALQLAPTTPSELLKRVYGLQLIQAERAGIKLVCEPGPDPAEPLHCDSPLIERVIGNLVGNALKFTKKNGGITLRSRAEGRDAVFLVSDTGPGIPADKLSAVFEKFRQLGGAQQRAGYGIGLAASKKIVDLHGGKIWVESEVGKGSTFAFRLPLKAPVKAAV
ncbi:MAG: ATP-binding protein [Elusimicrobiota bacterium]|jgi:signal transduction histidine kinase